jgi:hypothetical protein
LAFGGTGKKEERPGLLDEPSPVCAPEEEGALEEEEEEAMTGEIMRMNKEGRVRDGMEGCTKKGG